jgi:hypothetical protein
MESSATTAWPAKGRQSANMDDNARPVATVAAIAFVFILKLAEPANSAVRTTNFY